MNFLPSTSSSWRRASDVIAVGIAILIVLSTCTATVDAAQAETSDEQTARLIAGLRERRLFDQAEFTCLQALANEPADGPGLVRFTIELMRIRTDQARSASPAQQDAAWRAATQPASDFVVAHADHPQKILVQLQQALLVMERVEILRGRTASQTRSPNRASQALALSQQARVQLLAVQKTAQQQLINARSGHASPKGLTDAELAHLQRNVRFQLAICGFHRADLYSSDEALNRTSAIADVVEQLQTLQRTNEVGEPLWWQTQLALVRAQRLASDAEQSQELLERTAEADLKPTRRAWMTQILTEQVELMLARGVDQNSPESVDQLLRLVDRVTPSPTLDLACLRLIVAVATSIDDEARRQPWADRSQQLANRASQRHGEWWGQRATRIADTIVAGASVEQATEQLKRVVQAGQAAFDGGEFGEAFANFEIAGTLAEANHLTDLHRSCVLSLSQALEKMDQHADAAQRQIALAGTNPEHSSAASIHLRGCWNLGQAVASDHVSQPPLDLLTNALTQHLATWPHSDTSDQAKLWLGKRQLVAGDLHAGLKTLLAVRPSSQHRAAAAITAADALSAAKQHAKAGEILAELATQHPNDRRVVLGLARNETQQALHNPIQSTDAIARSLKRWRAIAKRLKPETDGWFEAKLSVIRMLDAVGETARAKQLLNYLNALPNGWRQSAFAKEFDSLQRKLK